MLNFTQMDSPLPLQIVGIVSIHQLRLRLQKSRQTEAIPGMDSSICTLLILIMLSVHPQKTLIWRR